MHHAPPPRTVVLYCSRGGLSAVEAKAVQDNVHNGPVHLVAMPCSSKVDVSHVLNLLAGGADLVLVLACPEGACRFLVGNVRAEKRIRHIQQLLLSAGIENKRVGLVRGGHFQAQDIVDQIAVHS
uniref:Hydrogenase iron-sulfur subunit n=1 Tax=Desulfatirhabdium butyrativorans TaxID=340467 RepID=A0A7C4VQZ1_9BACT